MALAYSPLLNSAKLNCSSEVTLHYWSTEARASRANSTVFPTVPTALSDVQPKTGLEQTSAIIDDGGTINGYSWKFLYVIRWCHIKDETLFHLSLFSCRWLNLEEKRYWKFAQPF